MLFKKHAFNANALKCPRILTKISLINWTITFKNEILFMTNQKMK